MKTFIFTLLSTLIFSQDTAMTLEDLRWENRVILYFPQTDDDHWEISDSVQHEIKERKLAYFIFRDTLVTNKPGVFTPAYLDQIESKYRMGSKKSLWVLIGLDGGVKRRTEGSLDWNQVFGTIDAMPMRQSEIRNNQ